MIRNLWARIEYQSDEIGPYVQYVILRSIDDVVDLRPSSTPDTSPFIETNQELIFQTNDQAGHDHQTTIETEPVYLRNEY